MKDITFEWNESKNKSNIQKHGISFEEAKSVFYDEFALLIADPDHSETEDRFVLLGRLVPNLDYYLFATASRPMMA
jgi:uncharacterized DUF497 family protein